MKPITQAQPHSGASHGPPANGGYRGAMQTSGGPAAAPSRFFALPFAAALLLSVGCGGSEPRKSPGDAATEGSTFNDFGGTHDADIARVRCDTNWEEYRSPFVQTTDQVTQYTRPFFTTCKDGRFYWDDWHYFKDGLTPEEVAVTGNEIVCPSAECKWGICKEDAEFIESQIPPGTKLKEGFFQSEGKSCRPCNPNSKAFYFDHDHYEPSSFSPCEGGYECCEEPLDWDGPCLEPEWYWSVRVSTLDVSNSFHLSTSEYDYRKGNPYCIESAENNCEPVDNARCRPGTATILTTHWLTDHHSSSILLDGQIHHIDEVRLTMGMSSRIQALLKSPQKACESAKLTSQGDTSTYFTCSGMASVKVSDGRWFKFIWIHEYDPRKCSQPCWLAADPAYHKIAVKMAFWEIQAEPKW